MTCTEDQFRSILREEAADISAASVPPLSLPDGRLTGPSRGRAGITGRRWRRWLVPLGAAAAVTAIAVAATAIAGGGRVPQSPVAGAARSFHGVPPYFLALEGGFADHHQLPFSLVARRTATGAVVATGRPPGTDLSWASWIAADGASDRTFVLGTPGSSGSGQFFLVHLNLARRIITLHRLPITAPSPAAIAVSPGGSELAVEDYLDPQLETEIQIYSLSGTVLRTWRCRDVVGPGTGAAEFAWGPGGTLAFIYHGLPSTGDGIRLLPASAPSGNLLRASRLAVRLNQPGGYEVSTFLMTGRGATLLALLQRMSHVRLESEFAVYSASTGRALRSFWSSEVGESLAWSNPSGGPAVVWAAPSITGTHVSELGVLDGGRFFPIPVATGRAGELLYVAIAF